MTNSLSLFLPLLTSVFQNIHGYSDGAPEEVCETLIPGHLRPPQNTSSPYRIELSTYHMSSNHIKYNPIGGNQMMNLTLTGHQAFKGFIIQARMNGRIVGRFEPCPKYYRMLDCLDEDENTATHVENDIKSEVTFKWVPPTKVAGKVWFYRDTTITKSDFEGDRATVFENKNILLNHMSNNKPTDPLTKKYPLCGCSEESSLTKYAFESESSKMHYTKYTGSVSSSSMSQVKQIMNKSNLSNCISLCKIGELRENARQTTFTNVKSDERSNEENSSALSISIGCNSNSNSSGSFLSNNSQGESSRFVKVNDNLSEFSKPLRLFNKSGKPLTDRVGRPLVNVLGERLVIFDDKGKVISDSKGNQVFNSLGESAIYPATNLYIPPSEEEPGIPLLDIDKEHILFLYDNKGHPLTDSFGRPLLSASGNPMLGIRSKANINSIADYDHYRLKNMYSRKPLENFVRYVQIFDSDAKPLTDDCGKPLEGAKVICNKNGMPMCDGKGRPVYFKSGSRISSAKKENKRKIEVKGIGKSELNMLQTSADSLANNNFKSPIELEQFIDKRNMKNVMIVSDRCISDGLIKYLDKNINPNLSVFNDDITSETKLSLLNNDNKTTHQEANKNNVDLDETQEHENVDYSNEKISSELKEDDTSSFRREDSMSQEHKKERGVFLPPNITGNLSENETNMELNHKTKHNKESTETVFLFNATEKMKNQVNSSVNVAHFEAIKGRQSRNKINLPKKMYSLNFFQFFKDTFSKSSERQGVEQYQYNEFGKPLRDIHGNLLYDKYGIPLTGAQGRRLSEGARQALRFKLRNVQKNKANIAAEGICLPLSRNESHDQFGEPVYDKYGRPLYDLAGRLIYDRFGRPLTDAFGRPLVDAIGQPLMDCEGRVLTSVYDSDTNIKLTDIFGRKIYDKRGRMLFDSYGRPKYDIFTNAIYDSCGRPATDANGKILFDFLNKPIQPYQEKPLYKNARAHLPKYIDTILAVPSMYRMLKYSQPLEDVFGGPLFDDLGKPLYNKIGKPFFDRYGRPLYDKNGTPLCDCYGRPLAEDIKQSDDDQTLSVIDCLKLLKVTEESSKWMIGKNKVFKSTESKDLNKNVVMKISYKKKSANKKSGQYVYTLTRVTRFTSGRQALEILEAPLSPSTVAEMHRLPVDNKPLVMVVGQRRKQTVKQQ